MRIHYYFYQYVYSNGILNPLHAAPNLTRLKIRSIYSTCALVYHVWRPDPASILLTIVRPG